MKISVLTPTYNRATLLIKLYESLINNAKYGIEIEWLIMNDGSTDNTEEIVKSFIDENKIEIKYFVQENQGKMRAINNLVQKATGNLIVDCDSDDFFTEDAFKIIKEEYEKNKDQNNIYGLCFLKYDKNGENMGNMFTNKKTTMFDLYFKEGETGEKAIVFLGSIRKRYKHELEHNERFVTEARLYHKIDEKYKIICINKPIMICEYQNEGYTRNIINQFKDNPYGYYEYFKEILKRDMKDVKLNKRLYAIKHYILFSCLKKEKIKTVVGEIKGIKNKILFVILYIPGIIKTKIKLSR